MDNLQVTGCRLSELYLEVDEKGNIGDIFVVDQTLWFRRTGLFPNFYHTQKMGLEKGLSLKILTKIVITAKIIVNFKIVKVTLNSLQVIVLRSSLSGSSIDCVEEVKDIHENLDCFWLWKNNRRFKESFFFRRLQTQLSLWIHGDIRDRLHVTSRWPSWWIRMSLFFVYTKGKLAVYPSYRQA